MPCYSVQEDCYILLAALNAGAHRKHGKYGGINNRSEQIAHLYRRICCSKGIRYQRSGDALKMRLYRLFSAGIMKWGPPREKATLCFKNKSEINNLGTTELKAHRENLLWQLFSPPNAKYCVAKKSYPRKHASHQSPRNQATIHKYSLEHRKLPTKTICEQVHEQYPIANPLDTLRLHSDNIHCDRTNKVQFAIPSPIAIPKDYLVRQTGVNFERHALHAPCTFTSWRSEENRSKNYAFLRDDVIASAKSKDRKIALLQSAYKENVKAFRELIAMQHETLVFMRNEYEKHRLFLKKRLDDISEQQQQLLQLLKRATDTKQ